MTNQPLPALKQMVDAVQFEQDGQPMIMLRDQEGINDKAVAISPAGFFIALLLNGKNTLAEILDQFSKNTGAKADAAEVEGLIKELDQAHLLETEALRKKRQEILQAFRDSPTRPPLHLDGSQVDGFFKDPKGPGKEFSSSPTGPAALGLASPHIDFHRGGPAYAWAYQALSETAPPDVVVALGVAHMSPNSPWVMTDKAYGTPYGDMAVHKELYQELAKTLWYAPKADEWTHRTEHSLEFQAFWLRYLWREKTPAWVPILCSSFERFCDDRPPSSISTVEAAIRQMGDVLKKRQDKGEKILILAGVDLAHVGSRFGDAEPLTPEIRQKIEREDRASLVHAMNLEADAFYMSVIAGGHWRKVCGLSALYTSLRLIEILQGKNKKAGDLLTYGQEDDPMGGVVSFTSAIWKR